ncbi:TonB-dependent receptor [Hymenobacter sp. 15J16-1T3B]|uniref:outer membrane beta-barrel protein n=1 Tax=Hymenobacter sp. 15J16-1T3B TaxID=2886941 RepID=UPI001D12FCE3|nr:outer membrane beta-barrel protein [Hymenobacter sp. 15J16-1T3B]MCC3156649.1 TonB-dependent receptor [Hymenobacter sp. 15J16-1T3B]
METRPGRRQWWLGWLLLGLPLGAGAQQPAGTVSGSLLDAATGQPVPFANVLLLRAADSAVVTGAATGETGRFVIGPVAAGSYRLRATVLGYRPLRRLLSVSSTEPLALGALRLTASTTQLGAVTVTGEKAVVQESLDKKVVNVAKDLTSVGGTAVNVLQNVPSVAVDQNGTVSLRGTPNVTIYVDGKPTGAAGGGRSVNLEQIPASQIEAVEVMTNPSARYDAEGGGGIINIILKKPRQDGFNGQAAATAGTGDKYNTSLNLNQRRGPLNYFGSYDFRQDHLRNHYTTRQLSATADRSTLAWLEYRNRVGSQTHALRLGLDYALSPEQTLTVSAAPRRNTVRTPEEQFGALVTTFRPAGQPERTEDTEVYSRNYTRSQATAADFALDYRRTWARHKRRELSGAAIFTPVRGEQQVQQHQHPELPTGLLQQQRTTFAIDQGAAQLDYVHPLGDKRRAEAGLKTTYRGTDGTLDFRQADDQGELRPLERLSSRYRYREVIPAAYAQWQDEPGKLSYQLGLRAEYTRTTGQLRTTGEAFARAYFNLFPSLTLARTLPHEQRLQLGYSRRINRPELPLLLPFPNYSDPRNYRVGNIRLRPETLHVLELGHQKSWGPATLTSTAFFRQTNDAIQRFRTVDTAATRLNEQGAQATQNAAITRTSYANVGHNRSYGLELSLNWPVAKWWRLALNGSGFRNEVSSLLHSEADNRNWAWSGRLNTTVTPLKRLDVQLTGTYRSRQVGALAGSLGPIYFVEAALKKDVLKDRGSISLRVADVFNTQVLRVQAYSPGLDFNLRIKRETRIGYLGFTYRFGGTEPAPRRSRRSEQPAAPTGIDIGG